MPKIILSLFIFVSISSFSQEVVKPRKSPLAIVIMKYENAYVKVTYSQPHKRGREIFGSLVPYGEIWRTGANEATEITFTRKMIIQSDTLRAGTYSLFTIPEKGKWTIIFNKQLGQWGSYNYHEPSDALRIEVPTQEISNLVYEPFTISFDQKNNISTMWLIWDRTKVGIPMTFTE